MRRPVLAAYCPTARRPPRYGIMVVAVAGDPIVSIAGPGADLSAVFGFPLAAPEAARPTRQADLTGP
jgi:hypothetical protein